MGTRYKNGSCLENQLFGLCTYSYIFLGQEEVKQIYDELKKEWPPEQQKQNWEKRLIFSIFETAHKQQKPLIFYGQN